MPPAACYLERMGVYILLWPGPHIRHNLALVHRPRLDTLKPPTGAANKKPRPHCETTGLSQAQVSRQLVLVWP